MDVGRRKDYLSSLCVSSPINASHRQKKASVVWYQRFWAKKVIDIRGCIIFVYYLSALLPHSRTYDSMWSSPVHFEDGAIDSAFHKGLIIVNFYIAIHMMFYLSYSEFVVITWYLMGQNGQVQNSLALALRGGCSFASGWRGSITRVRYS